MKQFRKENSSLALPECRAYEMVTPTGKEGFEASLKNYDGGGRVAYKSGCGEYRQIRAGMVVLSNLYVAARTAAGWETIPDLNGSSGSLFDAPSNVDSGVYKTPLRYSPDLLSSVWTLHRQGEPEYLRSALCAPS